MKWEMCLAEKGYILYIYFFISVNVYFILNSILWTVDYDAHYATEKKEEK